MANLRTFAMALALTAAPLSSSPAAASSPIAEAVATPSRSAANVKLDQSRKPAEVLEFLGLKPGMSAVDLFGGNRYWAEIFANVVGPEGRVLVWAPSQFASDETKKAFAEFQAKTPIAAIAITPIEAIALPKDFADFVMLNLNYHDLYWESAKYQVPRLEPQAFLKVVYQAMKPGAVIGIIDHAANPGGDTRAVVNALHRIDPKIIEADLKKAGFEFVGSSDMLRNPADDRSLSVVNPEIQGKTDRVILKFRKPS